MKITASRLREIIEEEYEEELQEKCKGRGCATPSEVDGYAKAIEKGADNKNKVNPYAVAWNSAKQKGSKDGSKVAGRRSGYKSKKNG